MAITNINTGSTFDTIQDAINAASAGDVISVGSGVYNENITINKAITLQGPNAGIAPTVPDIDPNANFPDGINVNDGYRANAEAWIQGTITVASEGVTIDGFRLRNESGPLNLNGAGNDFQLLNNYVTGYNAANAPTFGNANSNATPNAVTGWDISGNYIGGLTTGTGGSMYLAGLTGSTINNNTFWRPRAAHLYLASLTDVTIQGNDFYHGLHTEGFNEDGLAEYFSGAQGGYIRNYWFELKGTNTDVRVLNNEGSFNSGGIQLYSEANQAEADRFVFTDILIQGNNFPSSNFINPYTTAPENGLSGLIPAVMATAAVDGASGTDLQILDNTVELDLSQVKFATDHDSSLEVRGNFNGVTVENNTVTPIGTNARPDVDILTGLNLYGGLGGTVLVRNNDFLGVGGDPGDESYYGIDFIPTFEGYGEFAGQLDIQNNTITNWDIGAVLRLVEPGPDVSDSIDVSGNTLSDNERNVFDELAPLIETTFISYPEATEGSSLVLGTVVATDNLANTDNVGIRGYSFNDTTGFFAIDSSTGAISLTEAGLTSAANNFDVQPNRFNFNVTVIDGGGIETTQVVSMFVQNVDGQVEIDVTDLPPNSTVTPPSPSTPTVFVDTPEPFTFVPSTGTDAFQLNGGADVILGTLQQINTDRVRGAIPVTTLRVTESVFNRDAVTVTSGSAILDIDANNDGTSDSTITLEGDFTEALFLVNPNATANTTDINFDILNAPVNRFQNQNRPGTYLFAGEQESQNIRENFPEFIEEGYAFNVTQTESDRLFRLNRFQNSDVPGTYLFAGEEESVSIRANFPNFIEEGIAAYVAAPGSSTGVPQYRFQNSQQPGTYIFVGEQERDSIIANFPQFILEGVAFEIVVV